MIMKKITILLVLLLSLTSCSEDLVFNNPAFIGHNDGELWEATTYRANVDGSGNLTITGIRGLETVILKTNDTAETLYQLGNTTSSATYENEFGDFYSTNNEPDPELQIYPADGKINISEFNSIERTVSGTFAFNAFDSSGTMTENFNKGYFYNVPILSIGNVVSTDPLVACQNATAVVVTTKTNYDSVDITSSDYPVYCGLYKTALEVKLQQCGDPDGSMQDLIDDLGDCTN